MLLTESQAFLKINCPSEFRVVVHFHETMVPFGPDRYLAPSITCRSLAGTKKAEFS
jgi:hypothetical protein